MLGVSRFWTWILQRLKQGFSFTHCMGFRFLQALQTPGGPGTYGQTGNQAAIDLESPFASGGVGAVNPLQLHYTVITPAERKQQEERKKNRSSFLSTPSLVYYTYLMTLDEEAARPWTCNDPSFHTEHMDFSAGVCLDRAHCQLRLKHPWVRRKTKLYINIPLKIIRIKKSRRFWIFCFYETSPMLLFDNWTRPCGCWMLCRVCTWYIRHRAAASWAVLLSNFNSSWTLPELRGHSPSPDGTQNSPTLTLSAGIVCDYI